MTLMYNMRWQAKQIYTFIYGHNMFDHLNAIVLADH